MEEDLSKLPDLLEVCRAIFDYICSQPKQNLRHITFGALSRAANLTQTHEIIPAVQYLTGERLHLLSTKFEFIDGDFVVDIPIEDVTEAKEKNVFFHPDKGEVMSDFESKLFMYFTLSPDGEKLLSGQI